MFIHEIVEDKTRKAEEKKRVIERALRKEILQLVYRRPACQICGAPSRFLLNFGTQWRFVCLACVNERGIRVSLGHSRGYELLTLDEYKKICKRGV